MPKSKSTAKRFSYEGLDRVIHEKARLSLLTSLVTYPKGLAFGEMKVLCSLTDGNLNRHLAVLEEAKLVSVTKNTDGNRVQTRCRITALGRRRYHAYLSVIDQILSDGAAALSADADSLRTSTA